MVHGTGLRHFSAVLRLKHATDFTRVFQCPSAKIVYTRHLRIHTRPNECGFPRLGITVARRVVRYAVHRNQVKRQIRETFRHCCSELPAMDFVVVCRSRVQLLPPGVLRRDLLQIWKNLAK